MQHKQYNFILSTLNAKYLHSAFGLRYLYAQLGEYQQQTKIVEFDISQWPVDIAEQILNYSPKIVGLGVYIWNARQSLELVKKLKAVAPQTIIILGGPEVSYESESQEICHLADYVIKGEADLALPELLQNIFAKNADCPKFIQAKLPDVNQLRLPYQYYSERDISQRLIYVEASRGCPFTCEFCLSSLDIPVRQFELENFLAAMSELLERGALNFKFVDRTFNLNLRFSQAILRFFLERLTPGMLLHFEMVPDRLPDQLLELIKLFPAGTIQLEIGIQSWNPQVATLVSRRQDYAKVEENLIKLRSLTNAHLHVDLIAGLPGEDLESFGLGFNRLVALQPHEIQVGILKRLRGTPIIRHELEWQMVYSAEAPYEILQNKLLSFAQLQSLRRFARFWDIVANSGNFLGALKVLLSGPAGAFISFLHFSEWLFETTQTRHGIARSRLAALIVNYLHHTKGLTLAGAQAIVDSDINLNQKNLQLKEQSDNRFAKRQRQHLEPTP